MQWLWRLNYRLHHGGWLWCNLECNNNRICAERYQQSKCVQTGMSRRQQLLSCKHGPDLVLPLQWYSIINFRMVCDRPLRSTKLGKVLWVRIMFPNASRRLWELCIPDIRSKIWRSGVFHAGMLCVVQGHRRMRWILSWHFDETLYACAIRLHANSWCKLGLLFHGRLLYSLNLWQQVAGQILA